MDNLNRKFEVFGLEAEILDLHIDRPSAVDERPRGRVDTTSLSASLRISEFLWRG